MSKNNKIHKNRVFLTLIIMTLLMVIVSVVSAFFLSTTAVNSIVRDCKVTDLAAEKIAVMTEQQIEQKQKMLICYVEILENTKMWRNPDFLQKFLQFEDQGEFEGFALIRREGEIITDVPDIIGMEEAQLTMKSLTDESGNIIRDLYVGIGKNDKIFYAIPLIFNSYSSGFLIGVLPAGMKENVFGEDLSDVDSALYLLNASNEVVGYMGGEGREFRFENIDEGRFFDNGINSMAQMESIAEELSDGENVEKLILQNIASGNPDELDFKFEKGSASLTAQNGEFLWYVRPVKVCDEEWKLVMGKAVAISGESLMLIASGAILVAFVILFFFVLMVVIVVSQGVSNYRLSKLAYTDFITGYYNWTRFLLEAEKFLKKKRNATKYLMISLDIRKFRIITDIDGERKGEMILKNVADVLKKQMGKKEFFARFSIDEFGILMMCENEEAAASRLEKIDEELRRGVIVAAVKYNYGIYFVTDARMPVQKMYNYAGIARDHQKDIPDKKIGIFNSPMREIMVKEKELESHMEAALQNKEFNVYLQPKYKADGSRVGGAEALVRWISPEMGFISPGEFIPLFEQNGFILKLDDYMLDNVCAFQKKWSDAGKDLVTISVNMSRAHLIEPGLVEKITNTIDSYGIPHSCIELELTESAFFDDKQVLLNTVHELQAKGFYVSMDDFGSGYSSLNSLKDLPLDVVKLDGEFFNKTGDWARSETVIKDTINMAKHLEMKIVAEGIETEEQVKFLNEIGCDLIQGYYFAKPMPVNDFEKLMGY